MRCAEIEISKLGLLGDLIIFEILIRLHAMMNFAVGIIENCRYNLEVDYGTLIVYIHT